MAVYEPNQYAVAAAPSDWYEKKPKPSRSA
jgi:hypothetical protein